MSEAEDRWKELLDNLKRQRDEIALQMHLGKAEAREEWERLEKKWEQLKAEPLGKSVHQSAKDVGAALELLGDELKKGYERIKKTLSE